MPRQQKPMPRQSTVNMILNCLLQLGHEPNKRQEKGLPPPPTIPFLKPYTFRNPSVVNVPPTAASGIQSENAIILLHARFWLTTQAQRPGARDATIATATLTPGSLQCCG